MFMMHATVIIKEELVYLVNKGRTWVELERNGESGADTVLMNEVYIKKGNIKITHTCTYIMVINEQEAMNLRQSKGGVYRKIWRKKRERKSNLII